MRLPVCLAILALVVPTVAFADDQPGVAQQTPVCSQPHELRFAPGASAAVVSGGTDQSDPQSGCYTVSARKGQLFEASLSSDSSPNAAIVVFEPGYGLRTHDDFQYVDGKHLPKAGLDDEATHVRARLPATGRYLIMVGPARGQATGYTLKVRIR